jgi:hypothetical protein
LPVNLRRLVGGYFFLPAGFLTRLTLLVLDVVCFDFVDFLAMMLLVFYGLTPLRHVSFPAEEPIMTAGTAAVNLRGEIMCAGAGYRDHC